MLRVLDGFGWLWIISFLGGDCWARHGGEIFDPRMQLWQPTGSRQSDYLSGSGPAHLSSKDIKGEA